MGIGGSGPILYTLYPYTVYPIPYTPFSPIFQYSSFPIKNRKSNPLQSLPPISLYPIPYTLYPYLPIPLLPIFPFFTCIFGRQGV